MNTGSGEYLSFLFIAIGVYLLIRGFMTLTTGKLLPREEATLRDFSENGSKRFKLLASITNIISGLLVIVISVVKMLNLVSADVLRIATLGILAVLIVAYVLIRNSCKNMK